MKSFDLFCKVIDNYGDIGVCWRLARQLANEHQEPVRLWVDDLKALKQIWPLTQLVTQQDLAGVEVCEWKTPFPADIKPFDVVIEAFGCDIPESFIAHMLSTKNTEQPTHWINLEYLSAENWVEDCHLKTSIHPSTGLIKTFFFPGFTKKTGGLVREKSLLQEQSIFDAATWLKEKNIAFTAEDLLISLFAYENESIKFLLQSWIQSPKPVLCVVPAGKILQSLNHTLGKNLAVGDHLQQGQLTIQIIPFLTQIDYDHLLWACDLNFVRGEDSFVRAQWAAKPFAWHIYPQEEQAHTIKLDSFLDKYLANFPPELALDVRHLWQLWNGLGYAQDKDKVAVIWNNLMENNALWQAASQKWTRELQSQTDLTGQLLEFVNK